eukprot:4329012-Prymnesium_polylepis.3
MVGDGNAREHIGCSLCLGCIGHAAAKRRLDGDSVQFEPGGRQLVSFSAARKEEDHHAEQHGDPAGLLEEGDNLLQDAVSLG